jgi:putative tributyrin esterase
LTNLRQHFHTLELSDPAFERDGLRCVTVKSVALGRRGDVCLWIPQAPAIGTLLILLHGVYGSHWSWSLKAGAHLIAQRMIMSGEIEPLVIAMPSDGLGRDGSGYLRWPEPGANVERWIVEEVPAIARLAAPALVPNARIAIAGLSMGGFGALRLGAKYPDHFCAIAAHSAITDIDDLASFVEEPLSDYLACAPHEELSALYWMRKNSAVLPPVQFDCGLDDPLLESNCRLANALSAEGIPHQFTKHPGGHDWPYWQQHLADTLRHVDRQSNPQKWIQGTR